MKDAQTSPVFIHSLWRSGSTYIFNVFRRSVAGYWCYQEPIHEFVLSAQNAPQSLLAVGQGNESLLRHPHLDKPYLSELYETYHSWNGRLEKPLVYDQYFDAHGSEELKNFLQPLIDHARGRPVIQECRTSSRIPAIQNLFQGYHIFLWRNPRDQWWSFKVNPYFDVMCQMILNAPTHPKVISSLRDEIHFSEVHCDNIEQEYHHFSLRPMKAQDSYVCFFTVWCLSLLNGFTYADIDINIDSLSSSTEYRLKKQRDLKDAGISGLDFFDCHVHQTTFLPEENAFFDELEKRVFSLLRQNGYCESELERIRTMRREYEPNRSAAEHNKTNSAKDAYRAREAVLRLHDQMHDQSLKYLSYIGVREADLSNKIKGLEENIKSLQGALAEKDVELLQLRSTTCEFLENTWKYEISVLTKSVQDMTSTLFANTNEISASLGYIKEDTASISEQVKSGFYDLGQKSRVILRNIANIEKKNKRVEDEVVNLSSTTFQTFDILANTPFWRVANRMKSAQIVPKLTNVTSPVKS